MKALYQPLDKAESQIRVLRFENHADSTSLDAMIRLSLRTVSLKHATKQYKTFMQNASDQQWQDTFTECVDKRDEHMLQRGLQARPASNGVERQPRRSPTRYGWGEFEALSYQWGPEENMQHILVNKHRVPVTQNLHGALRTIQRLPETSLGMCYWIDQLCINQADTSEKNHQVRRMKEVYKSARAVIAWLGPSEQLDARAIQTMHKIGPQDPETFKINNPPFFDWNEWDAIWNFTKKAYWTRLWIIQELAVNHKATLFLCGNLQICRPLILSGALYCQQRLYHGTRTGRISAEREIWSVTTRLMDLLKLEPVLEEVEGPMRKVLKLAALANVSKPKDKVYGILGLLPACISSKIIPDYSPAVSEQQVSTELTKAVICTTRSLNEIMYGASHDSDQWPSWVPNPTVPLPRQHIRQLIRRQADRNSLVSDDYIEKITKGGNVLQCEGFLVDQVTAIGDTPRTARIASQRDSVIEVPNRYGGNLEFALWRTLVMDHQSAREDALREVPWPDDKDSNSNQDRTPKPHPLGWGKIYQTQQYKDFHETFRKKNQSFLIGGVPLRNFFRSSPKSEPDKTFRNSLRLLLVSIENRRLATTNTGYLCLVPQPTCPGDVVTILFGCRFPVVLRRVGEHFRVIGECYAHGLMNGEVFDLEQEENLKRREFSLC